jgi:ABC-type multidrug transport system ATPase subunit/ABC-type multidrug transport system permease subunit
VLAVAIEVRAIGQRVRSGDEILHDISLAVEHGELVAIIGASGSGKTTLLDTMSGLRPPWSGSVLRAPGNVGYVPQGDAIHLALPLARTLRYAALLREADRRDTAVSDVLRTLDLAGRSVVPVGDLSGGERKRASIAAELVAKPGLFFLDEPTSGLDPARGSELMRILRRMCDGDTTVVLTTHNPLDADRCDKIAVLANGGYLAFYGTPAAARDYFGADSLDEIYERLAGLGDPVKAWSRRFFPFSRTNGAASSTPAVPSQPGPATLLPDVAGPLSAGPVARDQVVSALDDPMLDDLAMDEPGPGGDVEAGHPDGGRLDVADPDAADGAVAADAAGAAGPLAPPDGAARDDANGTGADAVAAGRPALGQAAEATHGALRALRQWAVLTKRNADILARSRLTLAILAGSPVAVLLMFLVLFRPGAFDPAQPNPAATEMILFWVAFGGFFFGLTYGLLQICAEFAVLRRERFAGLNAGAYVLAKAAVLVPVLALVDVLFLVVLRALGRLPPGGGYPASFVTLLLSSVAALGLGLLISAAVSEPSQATIAMPIVCFPQVLFVGAILPVPAMALVGHWISYAMTNRWTFEALGHSMGVQELWANGRSPLGAPLLASYGATFDRAVGVDWLILAGFTVAFFAATVAVVVRKTRTP